MTDSSAGFTPTDLIAAASEVLSAGGYQAIRQRFSEWDTPTSRLFEDEYNVVGIVVFETCAELLRTWPDRQGSLVDVISQYVGQGESKSCAGSLAASAARAGAPGSVYRSCGTNRIDQVADKMGFK
jgi:hypothetical protein